MDKYEKIDSLYCESYTCGLLWCYSAGGSVFIPDMWRTRSFFFMNDAKNTLRSRNSIAHVMVVDDAEDSVVNMFVDKLGTHYLHTCSNTSRSMLYLYAWIHLRDQMLCIFFI